MASGWPLRHQIRDGLLGWGFKGVSPFEGDDFQIVL